MKHLQMNTLFFFFILFLPFSLSAQERERTAPITAVPSVSVPAETVPAPSAPSAPDWLFWGGIEVVPDITWDPEPFVDSVHIKYDFKASMMTTYTGSVVDEDLGLRYGFKLTTDDNLIGTFNDISGYIGYKEYTLRVRSSRLEGTASWKGVLAPGQPAEVDFDNMYFSLDIIYWLKINQDILAMYIGGNYTSLSLPMQIDTLLTPGGLENQYYGVSFYDPDYRINSYAFIFGLDSLAAELKQKGQPKLFSGFMTTQDSAGLGIAAVSKDGVRYAEALNPGTSAVDDNLLAGFIEYDLSVGARFLFVKGDTRIALAFGYNFGGLMIMPFEGGADKAGELGFDGSFFLWHYGPILKFYAAF